MNKSFKVVFNKARGALMVVNEVTSSVQAKGTKTVIATAVASMMMAGAAMAATAPAEGPITNDNLPTAGQTNYHTTKLTTGKGQLVDIQTNGSVQTLLEKIQATPNDLHNILGTVTKDGKNVHVVMSGVTGGSNLTDFGTYLGLSAIADGKIKDGFETSLGNQFTGKTGTHIVIGAKDGTSNPIVIGVVGSDFYVSPLNATGEIHRQGQTQIDIHSGNTAGVIGGNLIVDTMADINTILDMVKPSSTEAQPLKLGVTKPGVINTSIEGTNIVVDGKANVAGIMAGNVGVAGAGTTINGKITNGTNLTIDIDLDAHAKTPDGLVVGALGGSLAVASGNGKVALDNGQTTKVNVKNGLAIGLIGGGAAVAFDAPTKKLITTVFGEGSGTASTKSGDITMDLGAQSSTLAVIGGGVALSDACLNNVADTKSEVNSVTINMDGQVTVTGEQRSQIVTALLDLKKNLGENPKNPTKLMTSGLNLAGALDIDGLHLGNLGGGLAMARSNYETNETVTGSVVASSNIGTVNVHIKGGYNVMTAAGGVAMADDLYGYAKDNNKCDSASMVENVNLQISGGESVLVTAGGMAYATGSNGHTSIVKASSKIRNKASVTVEGDAKVDGLYLGGIAIDDTNAGTTNAEVSTGTIELTLKGGTISNANLSTILNNVNLDTSKTAPGVKDYIKQTAQLAGDQFGNVAILGGGLATGNGAKSTVNQTTINLAGGTVNGNVVAGGLSTLNGESHVETADVTVNGATINGSIYGAGLAGNPEANGYTTDYKAPKATVGTVNINLQSGSMTGDVVLGAPDLTLTNAGTSTVKEGHITLNAGFDFKGQKIDGSGADKATLTLTGNFDFAPKAETALFASPSNVVIGGFNSINLDGSLKNVDFAFNGRAETTISGGAHDFLNVTDGSNGNTMILTDNAAVAVTGTSANNFTVTNGVLGLGSDAKAQDATEAKKQYEGDAALYLSGEVSLKDKTVKVGKTNKEGVAIGANGMLIVDAGLEKGEQSNKTVVTKVTDGSITDDGGTLHYVNVADQGLVQIAGTENMDATVDNVLFEIVKKDANTIGFAVVKDQSKLDQMGLGDFNTGTLQQIAGQDDEASQFINGLMNGQTGVALSGSERNAKLKSGFNLGTAAGVQTAGIDSALLGIDEATKRASLTNVFNDGWTGFASVTGNQLKLGDSSNALETKTKLAGVAVGGEYTKGDLTFGALGHFGSGDVKGQGLNSGIKNDVDYYGFQAYAAKRMNQFNLVGQMGYVMTENDITHDVGHSTSVDADVFTVGVRGEMNYELNDTWSAVPYVGLNWLRVSTDAYTTNKGIRVDSTDQDLINMPIGVALSGDCSNVAGWTVRPVVDVAYVHTFGDTDLDATSHVGDAAMGTTLDVWSENVGRFTIGAEARNGNMGFGFKLGGAKGDGGHEEFFGQLNAKYVF